MDGGRGAAAALPGPGRAAGVRRGRSRADVCRTPAVRKGSIVRARGAGRRAGVSSLSIVDDDNSDNRLAETAASGALAGITARSTLAVGAAQYSLLNNAGGLFSINQTTGVVRLAGALDFETAEQHVIRVRADYTGGFEEHDFLISVADVLEPGVTRNGTSAGETLEGSNGADTLSGLGGNDRILGYSEADLIDGGAGADTMLGGQGNDTFLIRGAQALGDVYFGGTGVDTIRIANGSGTLQLAGLAAGDVEVFDANGILVQGTAAGDVFDFTGFASVVGLNRVLGVDGNDTMRGGAEDDVFDGGNGDDELFGDGGEDELIGRAGNDLLYGGANDDTLDGLTGNDIYYGGDGDDTFLILGVEARGDVFFGGVGVDTLFVRTGRNPMTLTTINVDGVERFDGSNWRIAGTTAADTLDFTQFDEAVNVGYIETFNGADVIRGGGWTDVFFGGSGNDTLSGGGGSDTMTGGGSSDTFVFAASDAFGDDRIVDFDGNGNDFLRFEGFGFGGATSNAGRRAALQDATDFDAQGALIDLGDIGGNGSIRLVGVAALDFVASEDFVFLA